MNTWKRFTLETKQMNYSATTTQVLETFTKALNPKGIRNYEAVIGVENSYAAITDAFSMVYFKSNDLQKDKISLDGSLRSSVVKFPFYSEIIKRAEKDYPCDKITPVDAKHIAIMCKAWKASRHQAFIQYNQGCLSLKLGKPGLSDQGLFFNPERVSYYFKAIPKGYELTQAYFINDEDQLVLKYTHKTDLNAPTIKQLICLLARS
jgi:hypothetical protein